MIRFIIKIYIYIVILDAILSYFPQVRNQEWARMVRKLCDFTEKPIRKLLPPDLPIDISPIIVIVLLNVLMALW